MTDVSVATWNLHHAVVKNTDQRAATWRYLKEEIRPTIALIQEAAGDIPTTPGGNTSERATTSAAGATRRLWSPSRGVWSQCARRAVGMRKEGPTPST